eukprot:8236522-Pyramimonas_sp.AAC.1
MLPGHLLKDDDNKLLETPLLQQKFTNLFHDDEDAQFGRIATGINWRYIQGKTGWSLKVPPNVSRFYNKILPVVVSDVLKERARVAAKAGRSSGASPCALPEVVATEDTQVDIVVVTHGHFMKDVLKKCKGVTYGPKGKFGNTAVWSEHAGQLRDGKFVLMTDLLRGYHTRKATCTYPGEFTTAEQCEDPTAYKRCDCKEDIQKVLLRKSLSR